MKEALLITFMAYLLNLVNINIFTICVKLNAFFQDVCISSGCGK